MCICAKERVICTRHAFVVLLFRSPRKDNYFEWLWISIYHWFGKNFIVGLIWCEHKIRVKKNIERPWETTSKNVINFSFMFFDKFSLYFILFMMRMTCNVNGSVTLVILYNFAVNMLQFVNDKHLRSKVFVRLSVAVWKTST